MKTTTSWKKNLSWILLIGWAFVILFLSSQNAMESNKLSFSFTNSLFSQVVQFISNVIGLQVPCSTVDEINSFVRIAGHFTEYFILGFLLTNAIKTSFKPYWIMLFTLPMGVLFSIADEFLQRFIPGRAYELFDLKIDFFGILTGFISYILVITIWKVLSKMFKFIFIQNHLFLYRCMVLF